MKISHFAVKHPVVIAMILIGLIAFGLYCLTGLNMEFIPDISLPEVEIITVYPGASAEDVENDITRVLENDFVTLPNYKSMSSQSTNSMSWISLTYQDDVDVYDQLTELRYRIDSLVDNLPDDAYKPYALVGGATMLPVMQFAIYGGKDVAQITRYINETLTPQITRIPGVAEVSMYGDMVPQIQVKLRMEDVTARGLSVLQVYQVLQYSNTTIPLGTSEYEGHSINVKYNGTVTGLDELGNLPVGMGSDNVMIHLKDIADIDYVYPEPENYIISEGSDLIMVSVTKRASGNTIEINNRIKAILENINNDTDGALNYKIFSDDSKMITNSLKTVLESGILGVVIAVIIIFLFLNNPRATLVIGSSIPLSILFTFIAMKVMGHTINLMTTSSFVVALGMVVDGSIVMLEQISRYLGKEQFTPDEAIFMGSDEVGGSIVASAMTTIVVFLPICFLKGMVGMILTGFATVLLLCIGASLLVSIIVVPFLVKVFMTKRVRRPRETVFLRMYNGLEFGYKKALKWGLVHRGYVIFISIILLVMSLFLVTGLGYSFIPSVDTGEFYINLEFPMGNSLEETKVAAMEAADKVRELVPENDGIALFVGMSDAMGGNFTSHPDNAYMYVKLQGGKRRNVHDIILDVQKNLSGSIPGCSVTTTNGGFDKLVSYISDGGGYKLILVGTDLDLLYRTGEELRQVLANDPDVTATSINTDFSELILDVDMDQDKLNSLGITSYEAGMISAILFNGVDVGNLTLSDGSRDTIRLSSDINDGMIDQTVLGRIPVSTLAGSTITFQELGDLVVESTVSSIHHTDRAISVTVGATLVSEDTSGVTSRMNAYLAENPLPNGVDTENGGIMGLIMDSLGSVSTALIIAVFLVYAVMVIQFERFRQPFIIMVSIPFCLIGVIVSLLVFKSSMNLMGAVSIIALAGIVVNNAIILVDYINQLRDRKRASLIYGVDEDLVDKPGSGYTQEEGRGKLLDYDTERRILALSVVQGGSSRLRPILMTTLTTLFGVLPMALAIGEGSELYACVGQAIAGGLLTSTLITLFIVPIIYYTGESRILEKS